MASSNTCGLCRRVYYANGLDLCLVFSITPDDVVRLRFIVFLLRFTVVFSRPQQDREFEQSQALDKVRTCAVVNLRCGMPITDTHTLIPRQSK